MQLSSRPVRHQARCNEPSNQRQDELYQLQESTTFAETVEGVSVNAIAESVLEANQHLDELPDKIPPAPAPGRPEKLSRFSRLGNRFMTDYQVLSCLHQEAKANQKCIDDWLMFVQKQGLYMFLIFKHF